MDRTKYLASQLGKNISNIGSHMPHAVVGILRKRRRKEEGFHIMEKGGSKVKPLAEYNPYPMEFLDGSM